MDYYQGVVTEYLRADRSVFVNTECCIQLNAGDNPDTSGPHWYCDAVAVNFRDSSVSLCEVTYSASMDSVVKRLTGWANNWTALRAALTRDCSIPSSWSVTPWVFVPEELKPMLAAKLQKVLPQGRGLDGMPEPRVTSLESVAPWKYRSWNRATD